MVAQFFLCVYSTRSVDSKELHPIEKEQDYRDAASTAMRIASQKKFIDALFEMLE
jgi:hypothetical protein